MIDPAWAQAPGANGPPGILSFLPFLAIGVIFYFLLFRPQQQKAKQHRVMLENLKRNDEVITAGGLYGKVMALSDQVVTIEIAPNVRVRVSRDQISGVVTGEERDRGKEKA